MIFKLPSLKGDKPDTAKEIIYFSCDPKYYEMYGYPLMNSIISMIPWLHVHCHIIYKDYEEYNKKIFMQNSRITYSHETITQGYINNIKINHDMMEEGRLIFKKNNDFEIIEKTYLASARFMRMEDLFKDDQYVFQVDCDSILQHGFPQHEFHYLCKQPAGMPKPKDKSVIIASAITPGYGQLSGRFRTLLKQKMMEAFDSGAYWFIDQHVIKDVFSQIPHSYVPFNWNSWGLKRDNIFVTGKGDKKTQLRFKKAQRKWHLPHHRRSIEKEIQLEREARLKQAKLNRTLAGK